MLTHLNFAAYANYITAAIITQRAYSTRAKSHRDAKGNLGLTFSRRRELSEIRLTQETDIFII